MASDPLAEFMNAQPATPAAQGDPLADFMAANQPAPPVEEKPGLLSRIGSGIADAGSAVGGAVVDTAKSFAKAVPTAIDLASPISKAGGLQVPFGQLADPSYRRELERGASNIVTGGLAEKAANAVSPEFAASAKPDAAAAPEAKNLGEAAGAFLPNPIGIAAGPVKAVAERVGETAVGRTVSKLVTTPAKKLAEAVTSIPERVLGGAVKRSDERLLADVGDGATKKMRDKINEKADDVVELLRRKPELKKGVKTPADLAAAAEGELSANGDRLKRIYSVADNINGKINPEQLVTRLGLTESALAGRLASEEEATALHAHVAKFEAKAAKSPGGISSEELREEITRLQGIAYDRSITAAPTPARDAASKAAGILKDTLEDHVERAEKRVASLGKDGAIVTPEQAEQMKAVTAEFNLDTVKKLNADQTVLMRLKKAAEYKASAAPNAGNSRLKSIVHGAVHTAAGAAGLAATVHGDPLIGIALAAGPTVLRAGSRAIDEGMASAGRAGLDRALAQLVKTKLGGGNIEAAARAALAAGATQATVDKIASGVSPTP